MTVDKAKWKNRIDIFFKALIVVSVILLGFAYHTASEANSRTKHAQVSSCKDGNDNREIAKQAWLFFYDTILAQPKSSHETQKEYENGKKIVRKLRAKIIDNYKPMNCSKFK